MVAAIDATHFWEFCWYLVVFNSRNLAHSSLVVIIDVLDQIHAGILALPGRIFENDSKGKRPILVKPAVVSCVDKDLAGLTRDHRNGTPDVFLVSQEFYRDGCISFLHAFLGRARRSVRFGNSFQIRLLVVGAVTPLDDKSLNDSKGVAAVVEILTHQSQKGLRRRPLASNVLVENCNVEFPSSGSFGVMGMRGRDLARNNCKGIIIGPRFSSDIVAFLGGRCEDNDDRSKKKQDKTVIPEEFDPGRNLCPPSKHRHPMVPPVQLHLY